MSCSKAIHFSLFPIKFSIKLLTLWTCTFQRHQYYLKYISFNHIKKQFNFLESNFLEHNRIHTLIWLKLLTAHILPTQTRNKHLYAHTHALVCVYHTLFGKKIFLPGGLQCISHIIRSYRKEKINKSYWVSSCTSFYEMF